MGNCCGKEENFDFDAVFKVELQNSDVTIRSKHINRNISDDRSTVSKIYENRISDNDFRISENDSLFNDFQETTEENTESKTVPDLLADAIISEEGRLFFYKMEEMADYNGDVNVQVLKYQYKNELKRNLTDEQIKNIFKDRINENGNGKMDLDEYMIAFSFNKYDRDLMKH